MFIALSLILALLSVLPAAAKLSGRPMMRRSAQHFGIPWQRYRLIGVAELAAAAGVLAGLGRPALGVAAALGMLVLLAGALMMHRRAGDTGREALPAVVVLVVVLGYLVRAVTG